MSNAQPKATQFKRLEVGVPEEPSTPESQQNYYQLLGLTPTASVQQIRRSYRELSKLYHPDTTALPAAIATARFQQLNEAYATLSSPERRAGYDLKIGYSRVRVIQPPADLRSAGTPRKYRSSAYLDPSDRPLSAGELFALFVLGLTFVGCLVLVITIGMTRGEIAFQSLDPGELVETAKHQVQSLSQDEAGFEPQAESELQDGAIAPTAKTTVTAPTLPSPPANSSPSGSRIE